MAVFVELDQSAVFRTQFGRVVAGLAAASPQWHTVVRPARGGDLAMKVRVRSLDHGPGVPHDYCWTLEALG